MNDCHNCTYRDLRSDSEFCVNCEHDNNVYTGWTSRDFSVTASNKTAVKEGVKYDQDKPEDNKRALDVQVSGNHYKDLAIQPVEYIHANDIGYFEGNVIKYVSRWRNKNGIIDLEKAKHYIELLIELEKDNG